MIPITLADLNPESLDKIPRAQIAPLIVQLASMQSALAARLSESPGKAEDQPMESQDHNALITVEEMAKRTAFTEQYCYDLIRRGEIPAVHAGKYVRIRPEDLNSWIDKHTEKKVDNELYSVYSNTYERKRTSQNQKGTRSNSSTTSRADRSFSKHIGQMGTRRSEDNRTYCKVHPLVGKDRIETKSKS